MASRHLSSRSLTPASCLSSLITINFFFTSSLNPPFIFPYFLVSFFSFFSWPWQIFHFRIFILTIYLSTFPRHFIPFQHTQFLQSFHCHIDSVTPFSFLFNFFIFEILFVLLSTAFLKPQLLRLVFFYAYKQIV